MGTNNYLISKEHKIAFRVSRNATSYLDEDTQENYEEFINYIFDNKDISFTVIKYLLNKLGFQDSMAIMVNLIIFYYADSKFEISTEDEFDELNNKEWRVLE